MEPVSWSAFATAAPDLADIVAQRFAAHPHHVLGTLARDGSPRLSGINVMIDDGECWIGSMPGARKAADLRRDPRCAVHSAPLDETLAEVDVRIDAIADELEPEAAQYWLTAHGPTKDDGDTTEGEVFFLRLTSVVTVTVEGEEMVLTQWRSDGTRREIRRT